MKKKILVLALTLSLVAITALGATLAYFTATDEATNTFTVGNVKIDLTEPNWESTGIEDAASVYPGEALAKDPTVTNTGANPCLVRVKVEMPEDYAQIISYETNYVPGALGTNWVKDGDYFYYMAPLAAGASTSKLFEQIRFSTALTADEDIEGGDPSYNIVVSAEAMQAQGIFPSYSAYDNGIDAAEFTAIKNAFASQFSV
jgi:predicted ribosomally synthesized peptide with SipW-like signal peptide